jgi:hypothetical protein
MAGLPARRPGAHQRLAATPSAALIRCRNIYRNLA